jgi:hypothetical protein
MRSGWHTSTLPWLAQLLSQAQHLQQQPQLQERICLGHRLAALAVAAAPIGTVAAAPTGTVAAAPTGTVAAAPTGTVVAAPTGTVAATEATTEVQYSNNK